MSSKYTVHVWYSNAEYWYMCMCVVFAQPIQDPDPFIHCDLMGGCDAFLTMARERHYKFSSLQ